MAKSGPNIETISHSQVLHRIRPTMPDFGQFRPNLARTRPCLQWKRPTWPEFGQTLVGVDMSSPKLANCDQYWQSHGQFWLGVDHALADFGQLWATWAGHLGSRSINQRVGHRGVQRANCQWQGCGALGPPTQALAAAQRSLDRAGARGAAGAFRPRAGRAVEGVRDTPSGSCCGLGGSRRPDVCYPVNAC